MVVTQKIKIILDKLINLNYNFYMLIYRLEQTDGIGIYANDLKHISTIREMLKSHRLAIKRNPDILDDLHDRLSFKRGIHFCGCVSLDKLKEWFGKFFDDLAESKEIKLSCYSVPKHHILFTKSEKQVAFDMRYARKITYN